MSNISPMKKTVLLMDLYSALKEGDRQSVDQIRSLISSSGNQVGIQQMNRLMTAEQNAQRAVREKIIGLSINIVDQEQFLKARGLLEVYSTIPKYYLDTGVLSSLNNKLEAYKKGGDKFNKKSKVNIKDRPIWRKAVSSLMGKIGYGQTKSSRKKVEQSSHFQQIGKAEGMFSDDQEP